MSWFDKMMPSRIRTEKPQAFGARGTVGQVLGLRRRSSIAPSSIAICTSARNAAITCASARASGSRCSSTRRATSSAPISSREDPLVSGQQALPRPPRAGAAANRRTRRADRHGRHARRRCRSSPAAFEFRFLGGSMGSVVGERFVRAVEHCLENAAAGLLLRERRRAHAGRAVLAAADGEDQRGARAAARAPAAVHLRDDRSDDRRRVREPRACSATSTSRSPAR